jgi:hypothetical protein
MAMLLLIVTLIIACMLNPRLLGWLILSVIAVGGTWAVLGVVAAGHVGAYILIAAVVYIIVALIVYL